MKDIALWFEIISAVLLIFIILFQPKSNSGMGSMAGEDSAALTTKRGGEKVIHRITIILGVVFALSAFLYHFA